MSLATDIKHWFGNWKLKRSDLEQKRQRQVFNLEGANRITILFDGTNLNHVLRLKTFVYVLSKGKELVSA